MTERVRVRVTHPRTTAARSLPDRPPAREIEELTVLGELYLASLMRSQRRAAFGICLGAIALLLAVALATAEFTAWRTITVVGVRLPWLLVGFAVYPVLVGCGAIAIRAAERNEREFAALMRER
jgi:hypothetical protein